MESQNFAEIAVKAEHGELTSIEIQRVIAGLAREAEETRKIAKNAEKKAEASLRESTENTRWRNEDRALLDTEAVQIDKAVKKKALQCVGGKESPAYRNKQRGIFRKVCMDIHLQIKRNYGLIDDRGRQLKYTGLKVKYLDAALLMISEYDLPVSLGNEVDAENELGLIDDED